MPTTCWSRCDDPARRSAHLVAVLVYQRADIEAAIDLPAMATAIENAYVAASAGEIELPPVGHMTFPTVEGDCHIKFGHHRGEPDFVIKVTFRRHRDRRTPQSTSRPS